MIYKHGNLGESALMYAEKGWQVYPAHHPKNGGCSCHLGGKCDSIGKHPFGDIVPKGILDATDNEDFLRNVWNNHPDLNVALATGQHFWVLEVDGQAGRNHLSELIKKNGDLPNSPLAISGSGGEHYYFAPDSRVKTKSRVLPSIDIRGVGGGIIAPPSLHFTGNRYRWNVGPDTPLAPAPEWLIQSVTQTDGEFEVMGDLMNHPGVAKGHRNDVLCKLAGQHLAEHGPTDDLMIQAISWGQKCMPPMEKAAVEKTVRHLIDKELKQKKPTSVAKKCSRTTNAKVVVSPFANIQEEATDWLWPGRIAIGCLTIIYGQGGVGKSFVTVDIAARLSQGKPFADDTIFNDGAADSLLFLTEDSRSRTVKARLRHQNADMSRVHAVIGVDDEGIDLSDPISAIDGILDLEKDARLIIDYLGQHPKIKLMVLDHLLDAVALGKDSNSQSDMRRALRVAQAIAETTQIAVLGVCHTRKNQTGGTADAAGSQAITAVPRGAWRSIEDPDNKNRFFWLHEKNNFGPKMSGLAYRINNDGLYWDSDEITLTSEELFAEDTASPIAEAVEFLQGILVDGAVAANIVLKAARESGISERTLKRAKKKINVESFQKEHKWYWSLPQEAEPPESDVEEF